MRPTFATGTARAESSSANARDSGRACRVAAAVRILARRPLAAAHQSRAGEHLGAAEDLPAEHVARRRPRQGRMAVLCRHPLDGAGAGTGAVHRRRARSLDRRDGAPPGLARRTLDPVPRRGHPQQGARLSRIPPRSARALAADQPPRSAQGPPRGAQFAAQSARPDARAHAGEGRDARLCEIRYALDRRRRVPRRLCADHGAAARHGTGFQDAHAGERPLPVRRAPRRRSCRDAGRAVALSRGPPGMLARPAAPT